MQDLADSDWPLQFFADRLRAPDSKVSDANHPFRLQNLQDAQQMGIARFKERAPFRRRQFVGRAVAAAFFAKGQRTIVRHEMFRKKFFRLPKPFSKKFPQPPPADFGTRTIEPVNEPFGVFARRLVYFHENFKPIAHSRYFAKGHAGLHHAERAGIHSQENDALLRAAEFSQIQFMRCAGIFQWIVNVRDRRREFQLADSCAKFTRRGNQFAAYFGFAQTARF